MTVVDSQVTSHPPLSPPSFGWQPPAPPRAAPGSSRQRCKNTCHSTGFATIITSGEVKTILWFILNDQNLESVSLKLKGLFLHPWPVAPTGAAPSRASSIALAGGSLCARRWWTPATTAATPPCQRWVCPGSTSPGPPQWRGVVGASNNNQVSLEKEKVKLLTRAPAKASWKLSVWIMKH